MHYSYCPHCGQLLTLKDAGDDGKVPYCLECHRYYFDSFSTCVIGLIENEDGEMICSVKVENSIELYLRLVQCGTSVEIISPESLKNKFVSDLKKIISLY